MGWAVAVNTVGCATLFTGVMMGDVVMMVLGVVIVLGSGVLVLREG